MQQFGPGEAQDLDKSLRRHGVHMQTAGTAVAFVCQCHGCHPATFPESEIREFYTIIVDEDCGPGRGGWVWSRQWNKGWAVASTNALMGPDDGPRSLCPWRCMGKLYESRFKCDTFTSGTGTISKRGEEEEEVWGNGTGTATGRFGGNGNSSSSSSVDVDVDVD